LGEGARTLDRTSRTTRVGFFPSTFPGDAVVLDGECSPQITLAVVGFGLGPGCLAAQALAKKILLANPWVA